MGTHCEHITGDVARTCERINFKLVTINGAETEAAKLHRKLRQTVLENARIRKLGRRNVKRLPLSFA
jgi:hypothetical protein